jgi:hypothetical protein
VTYTEERLVTVRRLRGRDEQTLKTETPVDEGRMQREAWDSRHGIQSSIGSLFKLMKANGRAGADRFAIPPANVKGIAGKVRYLRPSH